MARRTTRRTGVRNDRPFFWLRNLSDFLVGSLRSARNFDVSEYMKQLAGQGFTHVTVNGLGVDRPFESGPPGDVYSWFYDYSPDLDQFVESSVFPGIYPPDYVRKNLDFLKQRARLAVENGLVPGLHVNSPRSMPDAFWIKYPWLRGARIDHPRESFLPRYTLAMAHPAVQRHYRELVRALMSEVPEIGFIHVWTNDSGAGFEFTSSLYAGRNGGPYLIREWKSDEEIERKASENILTYFRLLRDEGRRKNPDFRLVCDLGPFYKERPHIVRELGDGIDAGSFGYFEGPSYRNEAKILEKVGAWTHRKIDIADMNVLGVPAPRLTHKKLSEAYRRGDRWVLTNTVPRSIAPYDVNGEILRSFQNNPNESFDSMVRRAAEEWAGKADSGLLRTIWELSDKAVRSYPAGIPYSTFGFPWFRLWVRPFSPNIDAIPEADRAYYERYLIATFNNPTRIDLNNDMLWNFLSVKEAGRKRVTIDKTVIPPLSKGLALLEKSRPSGQVFRDLEVRLRAARCFYLTMRNLTAWIEGVHGFIQAKTSGERRRYKAIAEEMGNSEIENARELLRLWETSSVDFIPISRSGESLHIYGQNFGDLLKKKIALMELHKNDNPFVDPEYMWRMD